MVYGRSRRYRRRGSRRRSLSNRSIYGSRSSKSQANQIAALRNRVNLMYRSTRPETRVMFKNYTNTFSNSAFSSTYTTQEFNPFSIMAASGIVFQGNAITMKNLIFRSIIEYRDNASASTSNISHSRSGTVRFVVCMTKAAQSTTDFVSSILDLTSSGAGYETNTIIPFNSGTSSKYYVLADRTYAVSSESPVKQIRFNIPLRNRKCTFIEPDPSDFDVPGSNFSGITKGTILVAIITSGLYWESGVYEQQIQTNWMLKLAYNE